MALGGGEKDANLIKAIECSENSPTGSPPIFTDKLKMQARKENLSSRKEREEHNDHNSRSKNHFYNSHGNI